MSASITTPNLPTATQSEAARQQIALIRQRFKASEEERRKYLQTRNSGSRANAYSGEDFERDLSRMFFYWLPHCVLSNIPLFSPSSRRANESGIEIDNLIHLRHEETNYIIAIEAKAQPVSVEGDQWLVEYPSKEKKCAKQQVDSHLSTLREYLEPISRQIEVKFLGFVVTPDDTTRNLAATGKRNSEIILSSVAELFKSLEKRFNLNQKSGRLPPDVFRVTQSPFLDLLRLSLPLGALGHPELGGALRYVERCRRTLDQTLFNDFNPKKEKWLINGSAGMGKSVLLAYAAVVLSSGYRLDGALDEIGTYKADDILDVFDFKTTEDSMAVIAMSERQLLNLKTWFDFFVERFQNTEGGQRLHFYRPDFLLARDIQRWNVLKKSYKAVLLDEAHDMQDVHENELLKAYQRSAFYLVAACDRFQKLRLTNESARVLKNFSFSGKSTRLKHVYRNPAPVYVASLALMFRWFAKDGPKVIPKDVDLRDSYGFDVFSNGKEKTLTLGNDAHPANYWSHCVSMFPNVETILNLIRRERLKREDVLWVRFSDENPSFDYETLHQDVTYHNCRTRDSHKLCDKYIKGQDFPIVVIEGFPSFMDEFETEDKERHMWQFRRELYLCASRATCFLYFVCDVRETDAISRVQEELSAMLTALGTPKFEASKGGSKKWQIRFQTTSESRDHSVFSQDELAKPMDDSVDSEEADSSAGEGTQDSSFLNGPASNPVKSEIDSGTQKDETVRFEQENAELPNENKGNDAVDRQTTQVATVPQSAVEPEYVITVPEPMSAREFAELVGVTTYQVGHELIRLNSFKNTNAPVPVEILRRIAPIFECQVVDQIPDEDPKISN